MFWRPTASGLWVTTSKILTEHMFILNYNVSKITDIVASVSNPRDCRRPTEPAMAPPLPAHVRSSRVILEKNLFSEYSTRYMILI